MKHVVVDLDLVTQAFEQRSVPMALGRFIFIFGVSFLVVGLFPPMTDAFVFLGTFLIIVGVLVPLPFLQPRNLWIVRFGGGFVMLLALAYLINSILALSPSTKIVSPVNMDSTLTNALIIANTRTHEIPWMISRFVSAFLGFLIGIELFAAGFFLIRLRRNDRHLLLERTTGFFATVFGWFLDLPPGIIRYGKGSYFWMFAILVSMLPWFLAITNIAGATSLQNFLALTQVLNCASNHAEIYECLDNAGRTHALGMIFLAFGSILLLPWVSSCLAYIPRQRLANTAVSRLAEDKDGYKPILFLRSVHDDSVILPPPVWTPMRYTLSPSARMRLDFDYLLVSEFMDYGTPRALGIGNTPFGAVRIVAKDDLDREMPDRDWVLKVKDLADKASRIVLVLGDSLINQSKSNGIRWELDYLASNPDLLKKTTIFIKSQDRRENRHLCQLIEELIKIELPTTNKNLISLSFGENGTIYATQASRFSSATTLLALRSAFRFTEGSGNKLA